MRKLRVILVAGLTPVAGGGFGGQVSVASTLFRSRLSQRVEFYPISSTAASIPPPSVPVRLLGALRRLVRFCTKIPWSDAVLIFSAHGLSLLEKGLMCMMARACGRGVVVLMTSGFLPAQTRSNPFLRLWLRLTLRSAHVVCSQGPYWTNYFVSQGAALGKLVETPNAVQLDVYGPHRPVEGRSQITFVGWMVREKGIFEALDAFQRISGVHSEATLVMAGGGSDLQSFRHAVQQAGLEQRVSVLGWVPREDIPRLLADTDVFILPSHFEGMPNALLEAMAASLPVVVTPVGSVPDLVQDGVNGRLVPIGDSQGLATAIEDLLSDRQRAMDLGRKGRRSIEERYDLERVWPIFERALHGAATEVGRSASRAVPLVSAEKDLSRPDGGVPQ